MRLDDDRLAAERTKGGDSRNEGEDGDEQPDDAAGAIGTESDTGGDEHDECPDQAQREHRPT